MGENFHDFANFLVIPKCCFPQRRTLPTEWRNFIQNILETARKEKNVQKYEIDVHHQGSRKFIPVKVCYRDTSYFFAKWIVQKFRCLKIVQENSAKELCFISMRDVKRSVIIRACPEKMPNGPLGEGIQITGCFELRKVEKFSGKILLFLNVIFWRRKVKKITSNW